MTYFKFIPVYFISFLIKKIPGVSFETHLHHLSISTFHRQVLILWGHFGFSNYVRQLGGTLTKCLRSHHMAAFQSHFLVVESVKSKGIRLVVFPE